MTNASPAPRHHGLWTLCQDNQVEEGSLGQAKP